MKEFSQFFQDILITPNADQILKVIRDNSLPGEYLFYFVFKLFPRTRDSSIWDLANIALISEENSISISYTDKLLWCDRIIKALPHNSANWETAFIIQEMAGGSDSDIIHKVEDILTP